ncbi:MAG: DUF4056 domain-containing protein [Planctomycetota bacterium]
MPKITLKPATMTAIALGVAFFSGCSLTGAPRVRLGSYATSTPGTNFIDVNSLGRHSYYSFLFENNGIAYTCRGGHIDIAHVRIGADNVRYLYYKIRKNLINSNSTIKFKLNVEPSTYFVTIHYPPGWEDLTRKEKRQIADELAIEMSQYFTFTMTTWHEVLTWFGYKCMAVLPEQPSAFSWEDIYSNLVGIRIGARALQDKEHSYNNAVTIGIKKELEDLGAQSRHTAWKAAEKMRGKWFDGIVLVDMKERNFDIGLDDGLVTPMLVPGVCENAEPQSYPVPVLDKLYKRGFTMEFEVEPKEFERGRILKIIYPNGGHSRIRPAEHIPVVVDYIKKTFYNGSKQQTTEPR